MTKQFKVSLLRFRNTVRARVLSRVRLCDPEDCGPPGSSVHEIPQARILKKKKKKNTGAGCHFLQGIFPTQGWNLCLLSRALTGGFFTTEPPGKPCIKRTFPSY